MDTDALRLPARSDPHSLAGQRVLVVGSIADSAALRALLRARGARVMASSDNEMALTLLSRFAIDVVMIEMVEPDVQTPEGEAFVTALRRCGGPSAAARTLVPVRM